MRAKRSFVAMSWLLVFLLKSAAGA